MSTVHIMLGSPDHRRTLPPVNQLDHYIGVDRGALILVENGYKPDLALGDFDSITETEKEEITKKSKKCMTFEPEKNDTDAELSLVYAMQLFESKQIVFYGWSGGRLDHLISILMIAAQPRFRDVVPKLVFINQTNTVKFYLPGQYRLYKENDKTYCSFIGMTTVSGLTLNAGYKYTLDHADYDYPIALISNEFTETQGEFSFEKGLVAFIQSKD